MVAIKILAGALAQELLARGVANSDIDAALHHLFGGNAHKAFVARNFEEEESGEETEPSRTSLYLSTFP